MHPEDQASEQFYAKQTADRAEREGLTTSLQQAIDELDKELDHLYARLEPVLTPSLPTDATELATVTGPQSVVADHVDRLRDIRRRVTVVHQRLEL